MRKKQLKSFRRQRLARDQVYHLCLCLPLVAQLCGNPPATQVRRVYVDFPLALLRHWVVNVAGCLDPSFSGEGRRRAKEGERRESPHPRPRAKFGFPLQYLASQRFFGHLRAKGPCCAVQVLTERHGGRLVCVEDADLAQGMRTM